MQVGYQVLRNVTLQMFSAQDIAVRHQAILAVVRTWGPKCVEIYCRSFEAITPITITQPALRGRSYCYPWSFQRSIELDGQSHDSSITVDRVHAFLALQW